MSPTNLRTSSSPTVRALLGAAIALVALALLPASGGAATPATAEAGEWIVLDSGRLGNQLWSVKAKRQGVSRKSSSCLSIGAKWQLSPYAFHRSSYRQCEHMPGRQAANEPPLIASGVFPAKGAEGKLTAVGMIFAAGVRRARVTFSDGSTSVIPVERLETEDAHRAGLDRYRYAAFSVRGPWCATRLTSQGRAGRTLWTGGIDTTC